MLRDNESWIRNAAAEALYKHPEAEESPIRALQDENPGVRWSAAEALGELGSSRAIEILKPAFNDDDAEVQEAGGEALAKLG